MIKQSLQTLPVKERTLFNLFHWVLKNIWVQVKYGSNLVFKSNIEIQKEKEKMKLMENAKRKKKCNFLIYAHATDVTRDRNLINLIFNI